MGMPPLAGFFGKVLIFSAAFSADDPALIVLAVIGVLNAAVAAAYYLRTIAACYLREPTTSLTARPCVALRCGIAACAVVVVAIGLWPSAAWEKSRQATKDLTERARAVVIEAPLRADTTEQTPVAVAEPRKPFAP